MTLIVGIIAKGGIVLASDSRTGNSHTFNDTADKMFALSDKFAIAIAGDGMLGKHLLDKIAHSDRIDYSQGIQSVAEQIRVEFATAFDSYYPTLPCPDRDELVFLLAGHGNDDSNTPHLYSMNSDDNFVPRQIQMGYHSVGAPHISNYILARIYELDKMMVKQAIKLSIFCIRETSFQVKGVGGKIKVGIIKPGSKFEMVQNHEVKKILDQCKNLQNFHKSKFYPEDLGGADL